MNARILELIKNPELIQFQDLNLLETEIKARPYIQNIRALYLYGTHQFNPENYQKELSKTAAYTTDKKILYQFINKKNIVEIKEKEELKSIFIDEEKNRNIVENEENILEKSSKKVDLDATANDSEIEKLEKENSADLSFHGIEDFMPNVSVAQSKPTENYQPKPSISKYEEEIQRLIAEVEAKIQAKKEAQKLDEKDDEKIVEEEIFSNDEINFSETQKFDFEEDKDSSIFLDDEKLEISNTEEVKTDEIALQNSDWKPMSIENHIPDALISQSESVKEEKINSEIEISEPEIKSEERPVFNVSFFSPDVSKIEEETEEIQNDFEPEPQQSNVPQFINTWQNWLKIEREEPQLNKEEIKEKAIENFIENEPKISKLKEETNFVVKERDDDISHLMTETFAKLYVEQRLYTKAIKAFEILTEKHPEKKDYFEEKIEEIKQIKLGNRF